MHEEKFKMIGRLTPWSTTVTLSSKSIEHCSSVTIIFKGGIAE